MRRGRFVADRRTTCALALAGCLALISAGCGVYVVPGGGGTGSVSDGGLIGSGDGLTTPVAVLTANRYQLVGAGTADGPALLHAATVGGDPPYSYRWCVFDPTGQPADHLLSATDTQACEFTAGAVDGPYEVICTITDSAEQADTCSLVLLVGTSIGLDITTDRAGVVVGGGDFGSTTIHVNPQGGSPPYEVTWTVTSPDGAVDGSRLDTTDPLSPVFASGTDTGAYVLTATVVDAEGAESVESVIVVVGQHLGLDVSASRPAVLPGGGGEGMARLLATPVGGREPYSYDWEVVGPDDQQYTDLLWDAGVPSPVFESGAQSGSFVARCAVTDGEGTVMVGSTTIVVGQQIGVSITADRLVLWPGSSLGSEAVLSADVRGGREPVAVEWSATGPAGEDAGESLSATEAAELTFTAPGAAGTYVIRCTATDADGVASTDALTLTVGRTLDVVVTADRGAAATGGSAAYGQVQLGSVVYGGTPPYTYAWTVTDSAGNSTPQRLDDAAAAAPVFSSASSTETYTLVCVVTDAAGAVAVGATTVDVGQPLSLDVTVDRQALVGGGGVAGQAQLVTTVHGGVPPYSFAWQVVDPGGGQDPTRLSATTIPQPVFTSALTVGTYRLTLTVTDARGNLFSDSVELVVGSTGGGAAGENLSVDVATNDQVIAPGGGARGMAGIQALATGGVAPLAYAWGVTDPAGAAADTRLDTTTGTSVTFTSTTTHGTYRVFCTVTDAVSNVFTDSIQIEVSDAFLLNVAASSTVVGPGTLVTLTADRTGGVSNFTYDWSCLDSGGGSCGGFTTDPQTAADDVTNTWTAPAGLGSYRIICLATDAEGNTFTDSISITVVDAFLLDVAASKTEVSPGEVITLTADRTGGSANFTYDWTCLDSSGGACAGFGADPQTAPNDVTNTWTAPAALDGYRLSCRATDADGRTFTDSVTVMVTDAFLLDVTASATVVAPGAAIDLAADRTGGTANFTYDWSCLDSAGAACAGFGTDPQTAADDVANTWTAPAALDTYRLTCLATDADGYTFTDSVAVTVSDVFLLDLTANVTHLSPGGAASLTADVTGGSANFQYLWTARDSTDALVGTFTGGAPGSGTVTQAGQPGDATLNWTAPTALGTYRITCVATDADAHAFTDSVMVSVTDSFHIDLVTADACLRPGATADFALRRVGGTPNLTYEWYCRDSTDTLRGTFTTDSLGAGSGRATQTDNGALVSNGWQAPAAGAGTLGTYQVVVVGTDGNGMTFTDSTDVVVDAPFSVNVTADDTSIAPAGAVDLLADRTGGETTFTYTWSAVDSSGAAAGTFAVGSTGPGAATQAAQADDAANTWTAPTGVADTYTLTCTAGDALGSTFTDSVHVVAGPPVSVSLDLTSDKVFIEPGETANLVANQSGGVARFDYAWTALNEAGAGAGTLGTATQTDLPGDAANTWTAPAAGAGVLGTYRVQAEVTDNVGETFRDAVHLVVRSPLSLNVTANNIYVAPSTAVSLTADQTGGETSYDYVWTATNQSGTLSGTFTAGSTGAGQATQNAVAADAANTWSVATAGTYTVTCTVTDNVGQVFTDSVTVIVTTVDVFSLDVTAETLLLWPGETVDLVGDRTGGTSTFNYAWSALNEAGASAGSFLAAAQNGVADDTTNTWTAPTGTSPEGTYRIRCTVTDALGNTCTDTANVEVSTLALQNIFLTPAAADTTSVLGITNLTAAAQNPDPGQQVLAGSLANPVHPRNVVITLTDPNTSITGGTARVTGLDARGQPITETIAIAATAVTTTNTGVVPFAAVTQIDLYGFNGVTTFPPISQDKVQVGVDRKFGLTGVLDAAADVRYVYEDGTVVTAGYTVDTTAGQQGITFSTDPNGARTFVVVFRAR